MRRLPLHLRLVAGFSAAMFVLLTCAAAFVYWRVEYALDRGLDGELHRAMTTITPLVAPDGSVKESDAATATGADWQVLAAGDRVLSHGGVAGTIPLVTDLPTSGTRTYDIGPVWLPSDVRRLRARVVALHEGGPWLVVAVRRAHRDEALRELLGQLLIAGFGSLAVSAAVSAVLARSALRPVERYRARAAEIAAGQYGLRLDVPSDRDDEVTRLGHTLNAMLGAQESALERERRFVQDASHELRTPLTLLKARIQMTRSRPRDNAAYERALDELAADVERLSVLSEQLLDQATPATGGMTVDLVGVARECVESRAGVTLVADDQAVAAGVDEHAARRLLTNLLDNALLHGAAPVRVTVRALPDAIELAVTDAGPGLPPDLLATVTGRFTRADEARSRPGSGLGLALVEQLVTAAGGELRVCSDDHHTSYGEVVGVACDHGPAMRVTVQLPRA